MFSISFTNKFGLNAKMINFVLCIVSADKLLNYGLNELHFNMYVVNRVNYVSY